MTTPLALPRPGTLRPALERLLGHRAFVPGVALLGLLARLALVGLLGGELRFWDERDYDRIARALLAGEGFDRGFGPTAFRPPGQPVFLAALQALGATARMVEAAQALLLTPLTFLGSRLARELGARPAAVGAVAAAIALHPGLAYGSATLFPV
ncbi:MAG TPA: hypothetical protein RMH80_21280, partial [Polyangiaceae bacterium LLY-WYZ-15_(1-7)]|nr:hypothetical protein [Polyangiaceae bacterium LLY-WYZ-15_(1-7)]